MPSTIRYEELNTADFLAQGFDKVIVPVGSCEAHGDAWWTVGLSLLPKRMWDAHEGYGHGGEAETSIALAMIPHLTDPARARGMVDSKDSLIKEIWNYQELTDEGATGDGRAATPEKGSRMKAAIVDYVVSFIERKEREGWVIQRQPA